MSYHIATDQQWLNYNQQFGAGQQQAALAQQAQHQFVVDPSLIYKPNPWLAMVKQEEKKMNLFSEVKKDMRAFVLEHKGLIYGILGLYLLDHFVLEGKLKAKLLDLAHKLIGKLETKVDAIGGPSEKQ